MVWLAHAEEATSSSEICCIIFLHVLATYTKAVCESLLLIGIYSLATRDLRYLNDKCDLIVVSWCLSTLITCAHLKVKAFSHHVFSCQKNLEIKLKNSVLSEGLWNVHAASFDLANPSVQVFMWLMGLFFFLIKCCFMCFMCLQMAWSFFWSVFSWHKEDVWNKICTCTIHYMDSENFKKLCQRGVDSTVSKLKHYFFLWECNVKYYFVTK